MSAFGLADIDAYAEHVRFVGWSGHSNPRLESALMTLCGHSMRLAYYQHRCEKCGEVFERTETKHEAVKLKCPSHGTGGAVCGVCWAGLFGK